MKNVKRVEIITNALEMREVCRVLESEGVSGYTVLHDATGRGERGIQSGDELSDSFKNSYLMTACAPEEIERLVAVVRPILKRNGGICLISDAQWVLH